MIIIRMDPVAFTIGSVSVRWYGIMITVAVAVLIAWMARETKRAVGLSYEPVLTGALVAIPSGMVVSKLLHVIDKWDYYTQNPGQILNPAGLTIYGAILGAALGIFIYSRVSKYPFGHVADLLAPGIILAQVIGRVGCLINGCCYGTKTSLPWGLVYTHPNSYAPLNVATHPTPIYEMIFGLIFFAVLFKLRGKLKPNGTLFALYLGLYSAWRLGIDFLRDGTALVFGLHEAQIVAIIVIAVTISLSVFRRRHEIVTAR